MCTFTKYSFWLRVQVRQILCSVIGPACFPTVDDYIESRSACRARFLVLSDVFSAQFSALIVALTCLESLEDLVKSGISLCLVKVGFSLIDVRRCHVKVDHRSSVPLALHLLDWRCCFTASSERF